ncbi:MAG: S24 family peptidase [Bauldia sp.]
MLSHARIWAAIDRLAADHELSVSALAKRSGLDPTTFNRSKRFGPDGRPRWPSTESVAKILAATGATLDRFLDAAGPRPLPLLGFARAGAGGYFLDGGFPSGAGWDEVSFPGVTDAGAYALEVAGDSMMPLYRAGDLIIVSPTAAIRPGDRVVVRTTDGEVMAKILARRTPHEVELASLNPEHPARIIDAANVEWIARILWASQ